MGKGPPFLLPFSELLPAPSCRPLFTHLIPRALCLSLPLPGEVGKAGQRGGWCMCGGCWAWMGCFRSDRESIFASFSRWTSSSWIPAGGPPCTWPPHWDTSSVPVCCSHTAQMWAGRTAAAGQVGAPAQPSPMARVSQLHVLLLGEPRRGHPRQGSAP